MSQRRYPIFPIPSIGAIVVGAKGILLIRRNKPPFNNLWNIVTGVVEVGETQEEAVAREVREETGINGDVVGFANTGDVILRDTNERVEYHFIVNVYLFRVSSDKVDIKSKDTDIAWFHPGSFPAEDMVDSVYAALRKMEKQLLQIMTLNRT